MGLEFLRDRFHLAELHEPAPASLKVKIRANLDFAELRTGVSQRRLWHWVAAATALLFVAIILWRMSPEPRESDYQVKFAGEIVEAHLRSLQPGQITGIASNDESAVKGWFDSTLKFAVPVRNFANEGFGLHGGRVDAIDGRPLAALVYARGRHPVDVFIWPTQEADSSPRTGSRQGYQWVQWRKGGMEFCAVSDAEPADLTRLHDLISE
jgi:anti-sigma factor RsiW